MGTRETRPESRFVERELASIQRFLARLNGDLEAAGFSPNKVVTEGIKRSESVLLAAIESMAESQLMPALRASKVAWLHAFFARSILDAEMTEQYLGDQNFLELKKPETEWREFVEKELAELEEEIIKLREEVKESAGG
tara:strand:- start:151 stop:567 length:417 start_codon:yes stop_codon:yes gene_type:complete